MSHFLILLMVDILSFLIQSNCIFKINHEVQDGVSNKKNNPFIKIPANRDILKNGLDFRTFLILDEIKSKLSIILFSSHQKNTGISPVENQFVKFVFLYFN